MLNLFNQKDAKEVFHGLSNPKIVLATLSQVGNKNRNKKRGQEQPLYSYKLIIISSTKSADAKWFRADHVDGVPSTNGQMPLAG